MAEHSSREQTVMGSSPHFFQRELSQVPCCVVLCCVVLCCVVLCCVVLCCVVLPCLLSLLYIYRCIHVCLHKVIYIPWQKGKQVYHPY